MAVFGIKQTKRLLFITVGILLVGVIGYALWTSGPRLLQPKSTTTITREHLTPLQKVTIGQPMPSNIKSLPGYSETTDKNGAVFSTYDSPIIARPNLIVSQNNKVVFERVVSPVDPSQYGFAHISDYTKSFGQPEKAVTGSKTYGSYFITSIYASKGFAFIANPNTDTVFEFQRFIPMSVEEYTAQYGQDLAPQSHTHAP